MKKFDKNIFLFIAIAGVILWQALLPGYVLSLDMVFTPAMGVMPNPDGFLNFLPVSYLVYGLCWVFPAWLVQKAMFLLLFICIGYLAYRFLPVGENKNTRLFSALLYLSNPLVYVRFLAGHWTYLMAYGLLPPFIHCLFALREKNDRLAYFKFFGVLFLIGIFSVHLFVLAILASSVWLTYLLIHFLRREKFMELRALLKNSCLAGFGLLVASGYWLVPAFFRAAPLEQRFGIGHWQAFSAGGYKGIGAFLNVASLNGFWGERNLWAKYFLWPQDYAVFWVAFAVILVLVVLGAGYGFKNQKTRPQTLFLGGVGLVALVFASGVGDTIFRPFNLWLYEHVFFWTGFRDSQKFSALLALSYAFFAGLGLERALALASNKKSTLKDALSSCALALPILFGFLMWGGFHGQVQPVWYPASWFAARDIVNQDTSDSRVLFLPWHGYLSLDFNHKLVTANPAKRFFGDRAVVSQSVEIGDVYDQNKDRNYSALDGVIRNDPPRSGDEAVEFLRQQKIKYIVYFQDLKNADNLQYEFLNSDGLKRILTEKELLMYEVLGN